MRKRRIGYAAWLLLAVCLYFFENNTGTRVVLLCSLLVPLIPPLRSAFFTPDQPGTEETPETLTVKTFVRRETEEPGEIRLYTPGDPVQLIHWKLSAKKDELLVRSPAAGQETAEESVPAAADNGRKRKPGRRPAVLPAAGITACALLLLLVPEARRGAQALCNRLFDASEAVNRYAYQHFNIPENQSVLAAAFLLLCIAALVLTLAAVLRSRTAALGIMAACTLFQVYFGLSFPAWINIPLYGLLALGMLRRPVSRRQLAACCVLCLSVSAAAAFLLPGVNAATETASETVRDRLAAITEQITGTVPETPDGESETRHVHNRSVVSGDREAETEQEFRLVTEEEEQISMPHWVKWTKAALLMLLAVLLVTLPFAPFLLLNARKKKAQEARKAFLSGNVSEAVQAVFRQVVLWLEATDHGAGNQLYRDWSALLPETLPEGYADRFARCAADCEEAVYSSHDMPERKRQEALDLLKETETALWAAAGRKQRLYLKYWMCLRE